MQAAEGCKTSLVASGVPGTDIKPGVRVKIPASLSKGAYSFLRTPQAAGGWGAATAQTEKSLPPDSNLKLLIDPKEEDDTVLLSFFHSKVNGGGWGIPCLLRASGARP